MPKALLSINSEMSKTLIDDVLDRHIDKLYEKEVKGELWKSRNVDQSQRAREDFFKGLHLCLNRLEYNHLVSADDKEEAKRVYLDRWNYVSEEVDEFAKKILRVWAKRQIALRKRGKSLLPN